MWGSMVMMHRCILVIGCVANDNCFTQKNGLSS
jgi:hypothetical protein